MISLNIISPEQKKFILRFSTRVLIRRLGSILLAFTIILSILTYFSYYLLTVNKKFVDDQIAAEIKSIELGKYASLEEAIKSLNNQLNSATKIQEEHISWIKIIDDLVNSKPEGLSFSSIRFNSETKNFQFSGRSLSRETLINYQTILNNSKYLSNINFPISSLIQKDEATFEITGQLTDSIYEK